MEQMKTLALYEKKIYLWNQYQTKSTVAECNVSVFT